MAQPTRTTPRAGARFGRTTPTPSAGRFSRPGTAQPRRSPTRSTPRTTSRTPSPFGRPSTRKSKKQSKGIGGALAGLIPTGAAAKATPSSKTGKAGGMAALAAAGGLAFRNRDKLTAMLKKRQGREQSADAPGTSTAGQPPLATSPGTQPSDMTPRP